MIERLPQSKSALTLVLMLHLAVVLFFTQIADSARLVSPPPVIVSLVETAVAAAVPSPSAPPKSKPIRPSFQPEPEPLPEPLAPSEVPPNPEPLADINPHPPSDAMPVEPRRVPEILPDRRPELAPPDTVVLPEPLEVARDLPLPPKIPAPIPPRLAPPAPPLHSISEPRPEPVLIAHAPTAPLVPSLSAIPAVTAPEPPRTDAPPRHDDAAEIELAPEVMHAAYLHNPKPVYPPLSRRLGEQGTVILRVFITGLGQAVRVQVKVSSGYQRLDKAAEDAVRRWRFVPAKRGDEGVDTWVIVPIRFSIKG